MTVEPVCILPKATLEEAARAMARHDVGALPVVNTAQDRVLVGIITDRDMVCRAIAEGRSPQGPVRDYMSAPVAIIALDTPVAVACELMRHKQLRRLVVVDREMRCLGIVSQADVARSVSEEDTGAIVKAISNPSPSGLA